MSEKAYQRLNIVLPVTGGATGALTQAQRFVEFLPTAEVLVSSIIITIISAVIGGTVGYFVKVLWDKFYKRDKSK